MRRRAHFLVLIACSAMPATARTAVAADVRVVFWFERARPLDTFKFQAYDLRKNEYTPDVGRWLAAMKRSYPGYDAYTRDLDLAREVGRTDNLRVGSAITREFLTVGHRNGYTFGGASPAGARTPARSNEVARPLPRVGGVPSQMGSPAASSPFPIPYTRPHP